jgi:beta-alanine degradation protein BauB
LRLGLFVRLLAFKARWLDAQEHSAPNLGDTETDAIFLELKEPSPLAPSYAALGPA